MPRRVAILFQCLAAVAVVGNLCALAYWVRMQVVAQGKPPVDNAQPTAKAVSENKTVVVKLNDDAATNYGIEVRPAREGVWREQTAVFGRVVPNPQATYEVRCPFPGTLQSAGTPWPTQGHTVRPRQALARVVVRVSPSDRNDLLVHLSEANRKKEGARKVVALRDANITRLTNAGGAVTPREMEDARVQLVEAETQLLTATDAVAIWDKALKEIDVETGKGNGTWTRTLTAPEAGDDAILEVADVVGQPGTAVEAGGLVVRLVDVSRPLVRLDLPAEWVSKGQPAATVDLTLAVPPPPALRGASNRPEAAVAPVVARATRVGPVAQADPASQFLGYYYAVQQAPHRLWRPGVFVRAYQPPPDPAWTTAAFGLIAGPFGLAAASEPEEPNAVVVPASAVLYHQGRALVYVRPEPGKFERREVQVLGFHGDDCYVVPVSLLVPPPPNVGVKASDIVVASGAQSLLSIEFRRDSDDD